MNEPSFIIRVPGSTANLGPGFDSIGLAVNRYLELTVTPGESWLFVGDGELRDLPPLEDNLIYQVAQQVAEQHGRSLPPRQVAMQSTIPLAKGLGSSAAAIVAAIELANQVLELGLTQNEKLRLAALIEGHPDNVSASVFGGLVIGSHCQEWTDVVPCGVPPVDMVLMVPDSQLLTKKARNILPDRLAFKEAVTASSISNVLVAALLNNDWATAGKMMRRDRFHHPYRTQLIPELASILQEQDHFPAYGAALSGAGPSIIWFSPVGEGKYLEQLLAKRYPQYSFEQLQPDSHGVTVIKSSICRS
ncbi:homoserine kinase [Caldalkalibacillus uzonensis]|uniref:Homoserine kinase n=1 Tax=Caldalkalibacillus uzonensis TaxID=353224 RepID=A0ABU0CWE7_9BACI|nr:homoserine kinase [Caldalkalibacillus uzonensis]MDQ0340467.1 homoserine kinase [Caldalkalibacillus uzonensis]